MKGLGTLLERQSDVQADGLAARVRSAAIGRLHNARPAAGTDHEAVRRGSSLLDHSVIKRANVRASR